jgi:hypothetical protein
LVSCWDVSKIDGLIIVFFSDNDRICAIFVDNDRLIASSTCQPVGEFPGIALDAGLVFEDLLLGQNGVPGG